MTETGVTLETTGEQRALHLQWPKSKSAALCRDIDRLIAEIARLKARPTSEEVTEMANRLDNLKREWDFVSDLWCAAALLRRLAAQSDGSEAGTAAPPADSSSDPDAVARAIGGDALVQFFDVIEARQNQRGNNANWRAQPVADHDRTNWQDVAAALAAAEKRGAERECERWAKHFDCLTVPMHPATLADMFRFRARSQPDERAGN